MRAIVTSAILEPLAIVVACAMFCAITADEYARAVARRVVRLARGRTPAPAPLLDMPRPSYRIGHRVERYRVVAATAAPAATPRLQQATEYVEYEAGKAVGRSVEWIDVPAEVVDTATDTRG